MSSLPDWIQPADQGMPDPLISYHPNSDVISSIRYCDLADEPHRMTGPASINWYPSGFIQAEYWYQHGKRFRDFGPSTILYNSDGAVRSKTWDTPRQDDQPSYIRYNKKGWLEYEEWTQAAPTEYGDSWRHRTAGPASIQYNADGSIFSQSFYFQGIEVTEQTIMEPQTITYDDVALEQHEWARQIMVMQRGFADFMNSVDHEILDETEDGQLIKVELPRIEAGPYNIEPANSPLVGLKHKGTVLRINPYDYGKRSDVYPYQASCVKDATEYLKDQGEYDVLAEWRYWESGVKA